MSLVLAAPAPSLDALAEKVAREHSLVVEAGWSMVDHAIAAGEALLAAKRMVPSGRWEWWLEHSFDGVGVTPQTLRSYMRLARHAEVVREANPRTLQAAARLLRGSSDSRVDGTLIARAKRMRADGQSYRVIGEALGVSEATVRRYVDRRRAEQQARYHRDRTHAARRALRRAERDADAKRAGGSVAHAYAHLRRTLESLERAIHAERDAEAKAAMHTAMNSLYNAEDSLNKAIRVSLADRASSA